MQTDVERLYDKLKEEKKAFRKLAKRDIAVDMTRGRPSAEQLKIALPMLENAASLNFAAEGGDARNYGDLAGLKSARELFAEIFEVKPEEVIVGDGSSLEMMYFLIDCAMQFGVLGGKPWNSLQSVKFICPAPGYDRHFTICEAFGISMITVPMREDGPDMDLIEQLVSNDASIKGIWCVPKYSNPTGITYSDGTVVRMGSLRPAAKDFRVFWDNSYAVHSLYEDEKLKNIFEVAQKAGNANMVYGFTSTSKITFAGSGVAALAASEANIKDILKKLGVRKINPNKVNQLMHVAFLKDIQNIREIMKQHAAILRPKFELFETKMSAAFDDDERVKWSKPKGGYFISLDVPGIAKRTVALAAEAGVKFTAAGATFPYKMDDRDGNIRIAPSVPTLEEMDYAVDVLISAIKIATLEKDIAAIEQQ